MRNPLQEILTNQPEPAAGAHKVVIPGQRITVVYVGRLASIAFAVSLLVAAGCGYLFNSYFAVRDLSLFGTMLMVWSVTALSISCVMGAFVYYSRRLAPTAATLPSRMPF